MYVYILNIYIERMKWKRGKKKEWEAHDGIIRDARWGVAKRMLPKQGIFKHKAVFDGYLIIHELIYYINSYHSNSNFIPNIHQL